MRLSCGDHSFLSVPHELALDLIAGLGFEGLNLVLWGDRSHVGTEEVARDVPLWASRLDERVRGRGLEFADVVAIPTTEYGTLALNHPDPAERERSMEFFRSMLDLTARLDAPGLTMLPGIDWPHESHEESLARAAGELRSRVDEAHARGVPFSAEPHIGSVCQAPADVAWLCETVPGLQLTLDYTHFVALGFPEEEGDQLVAYTRHFHARGGAEGRMQTSLRDSTIDYERILGVLQAEGYDGYVCVEFVHADWEPLLGDVDVLSETVQLRDQLRALEVPA
jgi:sugar phosphate isomerase/epimerase